MKDGHADAAGKTANKFNSWLLNLGSQREVYLVETPDDVLKKLMAENEGIYRAVVNKGDYNGIDKDIQVPGYRLCLIVNKDTPEDLVYRLVKTLAENWAHSGRFEPALSSSERAALYEGWKQAVDRVRQ